MSNSAKFVIGIWVLVFLLAAFLVIYWIKNPSLALPPNRLEAEIAPTWTQSLFQMEGLAERLEEILILSGDLPAGYFGGQISNQAPAMFSEINFADLELNQQIADNEGQTGGVTVLVFEQPSNASRAFDIVTEGWEEMNKPGFMVEHPVSLGEDSLALIYESTFPSFPFLFSEAAFVRCHAFIHIRMGNVANLQRLTTYADRLDQRLVSEICN